LVLPYHLAPHFKFIAWQPEEPGKEPGKDTKPCSLRKVDWFNTATTGIQGHHDDSYGKSKRTCSLLDSYGKSKRTCPQLDFWSAGSIVAWTHRTA
jgi:hypothetical protein